MDKRKASEELIREYLADRNIRVTFIRYFENTRPTQDNYRHHPWGYRKRLVLSLYSVYLAKDTEMRTSIKTLPDRYDEQQLYHLYLSI